MKKILLFLLLSFSLSSYGQKYIKPNNSYGYEWNRIKPDSVLHIPVINNTLLHTTDTSAQIRIINGILKYWWNQSWHNTGGGGNIFANTGLEKDGDTIKLLQNNEVFKSPTLLGVNQRGAQYTFSGLNIYNESNSFPSFQLQSSGKLNSNMMSLTGDSSGIYYDQIDTSLWTDNHLITKRKLKDELYALTPKKQDSTWNSIRLRDSISLWNVYGTTKIESDNYHISKNDIITDIEPSQIILSEEDEITNINNENWSLTNNVDTTFVTPGMINLHGPGAVYKINGIPINTSTSDTINKVETRYHAANTYHPRLGLTTLNFSADTAKFRGKIVINDSTVLYLPNQTNFLGSLFFGTGGKYLTHTTTATGRHNIGIGSWALGSVTTGYQNIAIGYTVLQSLTTGIANFGMGYSTMSKLTTASQNVAIGTGVLQNGTTGSYNTIIGGASARFGNYDSCVFIGFSTAFGTSGKGLNQKSQIKIGPDVGKTDTTNYTLWIDHKNTTIPLIGGRFDLDRVSINKIMPACGDSTFNVGGGIDARGLKLSNNASINKLKTIQISAALTDGAPTNAEINTATGTTPATVGAGWQCTIKDNNGSGLLYKIESDGTNWFYIIMMQAL